MDSIQRRFSEASRSRPFEFDDPASSLQSFAELAFAVSHQFAQVVRDRFLEMTKLHGRRIDVSPMSESWLKQFEGNRGRNTL